MQLRLMFLTIILIVGIISGGVVLLISSHFGPFPEMKKLAKFDNSHCPTERDFDVPIEINLRADNLFGLKKLSFLSSWTLDFGGQKGLTGGWMDSENQLWFSAANGALIVVDRSYMAYYPTGSVGECPVEWGFSE